MTVKLKDFQENKIYISNGQAKITTESTTATGWFAPTWYKRTYSDGRILYTCNCTSINITFSAGAWGSGSINLPVQYDSKMMSLSACAGPVDNAITIAIRPASGSSVLTYCWSNRYSGNVTTQIATSIVLEIFPEIYIP